MKKIKRILFFITSLAGGGAEKVLVNMVNHLDEKEYDITVQTLFDEGINKKSLSDKIKYKSVFKKSFRGNIHFFKLFNSKILYQRFVHGDYDIVVSYFQGATTRIVSGCPDPEVKLVQWIHNEFHTEDKIVKCYRSRKECLNAQKRFDATAYVAQTVKSIYEETFPGIVRNGRVVYNVVETDKIRRLAEEVIDDVNFQKNCINMISVGRMVEQKAFDRLIRIVKKLVFLDRLPVHLFLLGQGILKEKLELLVKENDLEQNITFLGYKENPYKYVKKSDVFVCSSLHEGFSTAVTEALIVGTPVITTECSGMKELLGNNQDYGVVTENDEESLYLGLKELLLYPEKLKFYKEKAKDRGETFNVKNRIKEIDDFFEEILRRDD